MFTVTGEYALRAAVHLAMHHPDPQTASAIAAATHVPTGYLSKILQELVRHGIAHSQRGLGGGFQLTRHPDTISVLEVLVAAGSPIQRINKCPLGLPGHATLCPVHRLMDDGLKLIEHTFQATTLGALCRAGGEGAGLCAEETGGHRRASHSHKPAARPKAPRPMGPAEKRTK